MEKTIKRIKKNATKIVIFAFVALMVFPNSLLAANLYFSPSSGTYEQNQNFSVGIFVSSPDQAMNAASMIIKFPTDKLQVASISKSNSIVDFWAQEPSFSNTTGEIKLEGVVLTPGYRGNSGRLLTVNFRGKNIGTASLQIASSSILANDGVGTNIQKSVSSASFVIKEIEIKEPEIIKIEDLKPEKEKPVTSEETCEPDSIITSASHPGIVWRRENSASFSWDLPEGILASKIAFDRNPNTTPTLVNSPAIVEKRYDNLEDGIWYFHLALQDNEGWRETEHFKIKIDHTPPTIEAHEIKRADLTDPKVVINLKIDDKTSCVKNFELSINGETIDYEKLPDGNLRTSTIKPGQHELVITAYDRAGNKNQKFLDILIEAIDAPKVTDYPDEIFVGEKLVIKGETIPNGNVEVKIISKNNNFLIREEFQSASGRFTFEQERLKKGTIFVSFRVSDARGSMSEWSRPVEIKVVSDFIIPLEKLTESGALIIIGASVLLILIVILITRALTIKRIRRDLGI